MLLQLTISYDIFSSYVECVEGYEEINGSCTVCQPGTWKPTVGNYTCYPCNPGFYQQNNGSTSDCQPCSPGSYAANSGQSSCDSCAAGTYQPESAQTSCVNCSVYMTSDIGSDSVDDCGTNMLCA